MYHTATNQLSTLRQITRATRQKIKKQTGLQVMLILSPHSLPMQCPEELLSVVAAALNMSEAHFSKKARTRAICEMRFIAAYLLRRHYPHLTLLQIGNLLGGRDHTFAIYCITRTRLLLQTKDPKFSAKYFTVLKSIKRWLQNEG